MLSSHPEPPLRVLFLDLDGVLNSVRSSVGLGGHPPNISADAVELFDPIALGLVRGLCRVGHVSVVLTSNWRITYPFGKVGAALGLPVVDRTPVLCASRGEEIAAWLDANPDVTDWAILDDHGDMEPEHAARFVHVSGFEGLTWANFVELCGLFGVSPHDCSSARSRQPSRALDWSDAV